MPTVHSVHHIRESSSGIKAEITELVQDLGQSHDLQRNEIIEKWRLANEEDMSTILPPTDFAPRRRKGEQGQRKNTKYSLLHTDTRNAWINS